MTLSKKYNEIMDKVVVTDEMRRRVLKEISSADPERLAAYKIDADEDLPKAFSGRKRYLASKILAGLAVACAIILIAGIIRFSLPVMSPSTAGSTSYEEATEFSAEGAEADTIVGNQDTGGQTALQNSEKTEEAATNGVAEAEDGGAAGAAADRTEDAAEDNSTSDRVDMPVQLSEQEIRTIVENYIGSEFVISDTAAEEDTLIYTISDVQTGDAFTYIRIHVSDGSVEIENAETKEISALTFRDLADQ